MIRDKFAGVLLAHIARLGQSVNGTRTWVFCTCNPNVEIRGSNNPHAASDGEWMGKAEEAHYLHVAEVLAELVATAQPSMTPATHSVGIDGLWALAAYWQASDHRTWISTLGDELAELLPPVVADLVAACDLNARMAGELERLGKGIERITAKHGAEHPEIAAALHRLLRNRPAAPT